MAIIYQLVQDILTTIHRSTSYVRAPGPPRQPLMRAAPPAEAVLPSWPTPSSGGAHRDSCHLGIEGTGYNNTMWAPLLHQPLEHGDLTNKQGDLI